MWYYCEPAKAFWLLSEKTLFLFRRSKNFK